MAWHARAGQGRQAHARCQPLKSCT
jgi:hypothetical protein